MWNCLSTHATKDREETYQKSHEKRHSPQRENDNFCEGKYRPTLFPTADGYNVELIKSTESLNADECFKPATYGTLYVLGYNGSRQGKATCRYQSKCCLEKRSNPNGLKPYRQWNFKDLPKILSSCPKCIVSSSGKNCVIEYQRDSSTDLFQVGRSAESVVDFIVMDTVPGKEMPDDTLSARSTISRFACRFTVSRNRPFVTRLFSSGFDPDKNMHIGESCPKWTNENGFQDCLTMNGVLLMNPKGAWGAQMKPGMWTEVSVMGNVYSLRTSRSSKEKGKEMNQANVLCDGALIDLCGAVLMWRTTEGLRNVQTARELVSKQEELNLLRPQCPVQLSTLRFNPHSKGDPSSLPHIYLKCGHVHGFHSWGIRPSIINDKATKRQCPICRETGPFEKLKLGLEPAFYVDDGPLTHCFAPCGHITSEATVKYWSQVPLSQGRDEFTPCCPFCCQPLSKDQSYVRLLFQTES